MHENKPSYQTSIFLIQFNLCILLLIVVFAVGSGYYGVQMMNLRARLLQENNESSQRFYDSVRLLDAFGLAAANYRNFDDPGYAKRAEYYFKEFQDASNELTPYFVGSENQTLIHKLQIEAEQYYRFFCDDVRFAEELKNAQEQATKDKESFLKSLSDFEKTAMDATNEKAMLLTIIRQIEKAAFQYENLSDSKKNVHKELVENEKMLRSLFESLRTFLSTEESKKQLEETQAHFTRYCDTIQKTLRFSEERLQYQAEQERLAQKNRDISEQLSKGLSHHNEMLSEELRQTARQISVMLMLIGFLAILFGMAMGIIVLRKVQRSIDALQNSESQKFVAEKSYDPYPIPHTSSESIGASTHDLLQSVADKLQEAVDLLRRK